MVGKTRLELATTRPPDAYANQLRYFPILEIGCKGSAFFRQYKIKEILFLFFLWYYGRLCLPLYAKIKTEGFK